MNTQDEFVLKAAAGGDLDYLRGFIGFTGDQSYFSICKDLNGKTALHLAAGCGMIRVCMFLAEEVKVSLNPRTADTGMTPVLLAASYAQMGTVRYLIRKGANLKISDYEGANCLHHAAEKGDIDLMKMCLSGGLDIESPSVRGTPLQWAAQKQKAEAVKFLLDRGANARPSMNSISLSCGKAPLAFAADKCAPASVLNRLIAEGADPNFQTLEGLTPVELAAWMGDEDAVQTLLSLTKQVPDYPIWSTKEIMSYTFSKESTSKRSSNRLSALQLAQSEAISAVEMGNYELGVTFYSAAVYLDPDNTKFLHKRSKCWLNLRKGIFALYDSQKCVKLKPTWAKAHYDVGLAWLLLENYSMASSALGKALHLDPSNFQIHLTYKNCAEKMLSAMSRRRRH